MTKGSRESFAIFVRGVLSHDYLNSVLPDCAGPNVHYAATSLMQEPTFNPEPLLGQATAKLMSSISAADAVQYGVVKRGKVGTSQRSAKSIPAELSKREKACLSWTAFGKSSWEIGQILSISENTVIFHIKNAMKKLGASSRTFAAFRAIELGLIELPVKSAS